MKKFIIVIIFLISLIFILLMTSFVFFLKGRTFNQFSHDVAKPLLEKIFNREVEFERLELSFNKVVFYNAAIAAQKKLAEGSIIKTPEVTIVFNPLKLLLSKGDFLTSLTEIISARPQVNLVRQTGERWNILELVPFKAGAPIPKIKIIVQDGTLNYQDETNPFEAQIINFFGEANFRDHRYLRYSFFGNLKDEEFLKPVKSAGILQWSNNSFRLKLETPPLAVDRWYPYLLKIPGIQIQRGTASLSLEFLSDQNQKSSFPVKINGNIDLKNTSFTWGDSFELTDISGRLNFAGSTLEFQELGGVLRGNDIKIEGGLQNFGQPIFDLSLSGEAIDYSVLESVFPKIDRSLSNLAGRFDFFVNFSGTSNNLVADGFIYSSSGQLGKFSKYQNLNLAFKFKTAEQRFEIDLKEINWLSGKLSASGSVKITNNLPEFNLAFRFKKCNLAKQELIPECSGLAEGTGLLDGTLDNLSLSLAAKFTEQARIFNQPAENLVLACSFRNNEIFLEKFYLQFKEKSFLQASGGGRFNGNFRLQVEGKNIYFEKPEKDGFTNKGTFYFSSTVSGQLNNEIFKNLSSLNYETKLKFRNAAFFGQPLSYGEIEGRATKGKFDIVNLYLREKSTEVKASGSFTLGGPVDLVVSSKNISLKDIRILTFYLPSNLKEISGRAFLKMHLQGNLPAKIEEILSPSVLEGIILDSQLILAEAEIAGQAIDRADLVFTWDKQKISFKNFLLALGNSSLDLRGNIFKTGQLDFTSTGHLKLADFENLLKLVIPWLKKYDRLGGEVVYSGVFLGNFDNPSFSGSLQGKNFKFNQIFWESLQVPALVLRNRVFYFEKPLLLVKSKEKYQLSGKIDFNPFIDGFKNNRLVAPQVETELAIIDGRLETILTLGTEIYTEVLARLPVETAKAENFTISFPSEVEAGKKQILYQELEQNVSGLLPEFKKIRENQAQKKKYSRNNLLRNITGKINGHLNIKGDLVQPAGTVNLQCQGIVFPSGQVEVLNFKGVIEDQNRRDNIFNPQLQATLELKNARLGEASFSSIFSTFSYANGILVPLKIRCFLYGHKLEINGVLPLSINPSSGEQKIDLTITVEKSRSTSGGPIFKDWEWLSGDGRANLKLHGSPRQAILDGNLSITGATLKNRSPYGEINYLRDFTLKIDVQQNVAEIKKAYFKWQGKNTKNKINVFDITGKIDFVKLFDPENWQVGVEKLKLADTTLFLDYPLIYTGRLDLKNLILRGPIDRRSFEESPTIYSWFKTLPGPAPIVKVQEKSGLSLSGDLTLSDGALIIPESTSHQQLPSTTLFLNLSVGPHLKIAGAPLLVSGRKELGGLITKGVLTGVTLELTETDKPFLVTGSLTDPQFEQHLLVKEGGFSFLGCPFVLIGPARQKQYFYQNLPLVGENHLNFKYGDFTNSSGIVKKGLLVSLKLVGETEIVRRDNLSRQLSSEKHKLLAIIEGHLNELKLNFEEYQLGAGGHFELVARYTMDDPLTIIKLLAPQLLTAFIKPGADRSQALADFSSQQIQAIFQDSLRPIEEKIETSAGLDDVRLEYDLGDRLASSLFKTTPSEEKHRLGVSVAKSLLFDKLYLRVKYAQDLRNFVRLQGSLLTYQIVYWLNHNYSLDYSREIDEVNQNLLYNDAFTIGANYQF